MTTEARQAGRLVRALGADLRGARVYALLAATDDPRSLVRAAAALDRRAPGGAYFRARLWLRAAELVAGRSWPEITPPGLIALAAQLGVADREVRRNVMLGRKIAAFERLHPELGAALGAAPPETIDFSARLNGKGPAYLAQAATLLREQPRLTARQVHAQWTRKQGSIKANLDVIKPSDWWAFSRPKWPQDSDFPGSIPGEVYANALYYFAPRCGIAVDPMAGSGMLRRVYADRALWEKDSAFDLDVRLYDLHPRRSFIEAHDVRRPLPVQADWIFLDPPYFRQSQHLYEGDLATTRDYPTYLRLLGEALSAMAVSLRPGGRLCVFLPKWSGQRPSDPNLDLPADARALATGAGLRWVDTAYVSRGRQQEPGSATKNAAAKRDRRMRSDTCVLQVFELEGH